MESNRVKQTVHNRVDLTIAFHYKSTNLLLHYSLKYTAALTVMAIRVPFASTAFIL